MPEQIHLQKVSLAGLARPECKRSVEYLPILRIQTHNHLVLLMKARQATCPGKTLS